MPALEVQDLAVDYRGRPALANVQLSIGRGRILAIVGPSGCGKTTLLNCVNRLTDLIPGCNVAGQILLGRENVLQTKDLLALRRRIGMVFQKPNPFPLSIRRNLSLPLREHGCPRNLVEPIITRSLRDVGLWDEVHDRLDAPAQELSGGQQQRLCIARALALQPEILLFDEPCSALDPLSSAAVEELIVKLRARATLVVVTHNLSQARRIADDAAVVWNRGQGGTVIECGPAAEVFSRPTDPDAAAYLSREG